MPDSPDAAMPRPLIALFACAAGLSVANVYYAQPLLDTLAAEFALSHGAAGGVVAATQAGCALALFALVPLGDGVNRRRLMLAQAAALTAALVGVALAGSAASLLAGMLAVGLLGTAMTQGLIAYAAATASGAERGRVVGAAQGGVVVGLLLARVAAGAIADLAGWRMVYLCSAATMLALALALLLGRTLPAPQRPPQRQPYLKLIGSMLALLRHERTLRIRGVIGLLMFAAFSAFWSALVLPLSAGPDALSHAQIGAFGLVGAAGALAASHAGRWIDRGRGQQVSGLGLVLLLAAWLPLYFGIASLPALVLGILLLDLGAQAIHVANQSMILRTRPDAHSRLIGAYMLFYSAGSGLGALASTMVYATAGWPGVCILGAALSLSALAFWRATLGAMPGACRDDKIAA